MFELLFFFILSARAPSLSLITFLGVVLASFFSKHRRPNQRICFDLSLSCYALFLIDNKTNFIVTFSTVGPIGWAKKPQVPQRLRNEARMLHIVDDCLSHVLVQFTTLFNFFCPSPANRWKEWIFFKLIIVKIKFQFKSVTRSKASVWFSIKDEFKTSDKFSGLRWESWFPFNKPRLFNFLLFAGSTWPSNVPLLHKRRTHAQVIRCFVMERLDLVDRKPSPVGFVSFSIVNTWEFWTSVPHFFIVDVVVVVCLLVLLLLSPVGQFSKR